MRQLLLGLAIGLLVARAAPARAQQGSIQISASAQALTGDPARLAGQRTLEPDIGVTWLQPGSRFGTFHIDLRGTNRTGRPHLGRAYGALRDVKYRGFSWTFEGGDGYFAPSIGDYRFSNLFTPTITFAGGAITARTKKTTIAMVAGRTTAWRNIFGTDPETLGQRLAVGQVAHRYSSRLEIQGRGSDIRTRGLKEFGYAIASSRQAGGGVRLLLTPAIQLVGDGSMVSYRREGSEDTRRDASFLTGTNWLLARGWLQLNAYRFSPGEFPVLNYPLQDRHGLFSAGEYDLLPRVRVFAGWESFHANLNPTDSAASSRPTPQTDGSRHFAGFRVQPWSRSAVTLRYEDGDRLAKPVRPGLGAPTDSDTGAWTVEWQGIFGRATTFTRYSRRENVDRSNVAGSFTQHDASAQLFLTLSRSTQLFGLSTITQNTTAEGGGSTYWQTGGGTQVQLPRRNVWMRAEGTLSRNIDLLTDSFVPRESLNLGVNGQLSRQTHIAFNVYLDRAPTHSVTGSPWMTRSMLRLTHTMSTGAARISSGAIATSASKRSAGTGSILGNVFADWNANGIADADDGPLEGIAIRVGSITNTMTARNGQFSFLNVPAGMQDVMLDATALPVDFDPPAQPQVQVELGRGETRRVSFGLIPLGSISGRVIRDANANGSADPGEQPIDGAILVLDGGVRSEQARRGRFRFDAVRSGEHTVQLLLESLEDGAKTTGPASQAVSLTREGLRADLVFLVSIEKRPEIRRVFPSKAGAAPRPSSPQTNRRLSSPTAKAAEAPPPAAAPAHVPYTIQVAALRNAARARALVRALTDSGHAAYLVEPRPSEPNGPFRVCVGQYPTRAAAEGTRARLETERGEPVWVKRDPR